MRLLPILVGALALAPPASAEAPPLRVPLERYPLPNGLVVILHEDHRAPTVSVDLWFRVGSKDEAPGRTGFAHLFEHLMFMGTHRVPNGQFDAIMEAEGGQNNATTSEDRTNYFETGPSHLLETFLWLEADRLSSLADDMTKEKLDLQRDVVKNERRQSFENRPYGRAELALPEHMYPEGHPYHHPVIGSHQDLSAASVDDVKAFFRTWYVPSNASLVVAGDFQPAEAKKLVEKYFGWMAKQPEPTHATPPPARLAKSEVVTIPDAVKLERVVMAWHSPAAFAAGDEECDLLAAALGLGKSSRLYRALVYETKLAQSVTVEQRGSRYGGLFVVTATAQPGHTAADLQHAIEIGLASALGIQRGRLAKAPRGPFLDGEIARARANVETQQLRAVEKVFNLGDMLNAFQFYLGDPRAIETRLLGRYDGVTANEVTRRARAILSQPHLAIRVVPEAETKAKAKGGGR